MPRKGWMARLFDHFHTHPRGHIHEQFFFMGLGLLLGLLAFAGWRTGVLSVPLALILGVVSLSVFGFGLLPAKRPAPKPAEPGRRSKRK